MAHVVWSGGRGTRRSTMQLPDPALGRLLDEHDGLAAFDGGLRIFGETDRDLPSIDTWNRQDGWRATYGDLADGVRIFAEDVFGNQFGFSDGRIVRFLSETGERQMLADSFDEWLELMFRDPPLELSLDMLRSWRRQGNAVRLAEHLCPKLPFVAGGRFESENLYVVDRYASIQFKGDFATQIKNVPDGGRIRIKTID